MTAVPPPEQIGPARERVKWRSPWDFPERLRDALATVGDDPGPADVRVVPVIPGHHWEFDALVVSDRFTDLSESDRQRVLWDLVYDHLADEEERVGVLTGLSVAEAEQLRRDEPSDGGIPPTTQDRAPADKPGPNP